MGKKKTSGDAPHLGNVARVIGRIEALEPLSKGGCALCGLATPKVKLRLSYSAARGVGRDERRGRRGKLAKLQWSEGPWHQPPHETQQHVLHFLALDDAMSFMSSFHVLGLT